MSVGEDRAQRGEVARPPAVEVGGRDRRGFVIARHIATVPQSAEELLAEFRARYPGVGIALSEDASDRLIEFLRDGRLDLALIGSAGDAFPGLETAIVADEALVAAVSADDPLDRTP
jgi:DNA-binding transcriptional LysR family regulator